MKVNGHNSATRIETNKHSAQSDRNKSPIEGNNHQTIGTGNSEIILSDRASLLYRLAEKIAALPIVNQSLVNSLKMKIAAGELIDNYYPVAEKLIASEQSLANYQY